MNRRRICAATTKSIETSGWPRRKSGIGLIPNTERASSRHHAVPRPGGPKNAVPIARRTTKRTASVSANRGWSIGPSRRARPSARPTIGPTNRRTKTRSTPTSTLGSAPIATLTRPPSGRQKRPSTATPALIASEPTNRSNGTTSSQSVSETPRRWTASRTSSPHAGRATPRSLGHDARDRCPRSSLPPCCPTSRARFAASH